MKFRDYIKEESALPSGFEDFGFSDDEVNKSKSRKEVAPIKKAERGSIIQIGKTKWIVFRKVSDYTVWVYKYGTKQRKLYEISPATSKEVYGVWQTTGSTKKVSDKPVVTGKPKIIGKE